MIKMEHVSLTRGERQILHDVTLTISPGEHWVILGRNGSGKNDAPRAADRLSIPKQRQG